MLALRLLTVSLGTLMYAACGLQASLDQDEAETAQRQGRLSAVIQVNGYPCPTQTAVRIVRNSYGHRSYHVTCRCPSTGVGTIVDPLAMTTPTVPCRPGLIHYLVTHNPFAPHGSLNAFIVEPALP